MSSAEVIDALFERTVDIVQSLPKSGPIQTSYEEKLALYSLYKQATEGNVTSKRPGMLDMLGRAKYDAWVNRRGLGAQDAKQLYVESMLRTLRKFSDRPQAMALIEELESFSGDVAQRVMSASLARDDDSDSEASVTGARGQPQERLPRLTSQQLHLPPSASGATMYDTAVDAEDERDAVSQLPRRGPAGRYAGSTTASAAAGLRSGQRTPQSIADGASAMAVRPDSSLGGAQSDQDDSDTDDAGRPDPSRQRGGGMRSHVPLPTQHRTSIGGASTGRRGGMPPPQQSPWQRSSASMAGEGRLYAPAGGQRYPGPPASDAPGGMGGGAGASLYSAVGPSARPTPSEQHYYHRHGGHTGDTSTRPDPASSVGGRSAGGGPGVRADVDLALQSIQASLAALHERMNRVEGTGAARGTNANGGSRSSGWLGGVSRRGPLAAGYRAVANALHDIGVLLGLRSDGRGGAAPSTYRGDGAESHATHSRRARGGGASSPSSGSGAGGGARRWTVIIRLIVALVQLAVRLALDLTSVVVVVSVLLLVVKRTTGRGDPLLILRLMRTWLGVRVPASRTIERVAAAASGEGKSGSSSREK